MKVLHLPSWYPNKADRFTGDFIQRHAQAAALYDEVIVLFVIRNDEFAGKKKVIEEIKTTGNLTEHIIYYSSVKTLNPFNKLSSLIARSALYDRAIKKYMADAEPPVLAHVQVVMNAGLIALRLKRKYSLPYIVTEHNGIYNDVLKQAFKRRSGTFRHYTKMIFKKASLFMSVSESLAGDVNREVVSIPYQVVYNTVDTSLFFNTAKKKTSHTFRFIHVSNIIPLKNLEGIIRAFSEVIKTSPAVELFIVGAYYPEVYRVAEETGLLKKSIFFTGEITYPQVAQQMQQSNALVLFSDTENMPCVVLEALCCGIPVIASRVGGIPEIINNSNGILVKPRDETAMKLAMEKMLNNYELFDAKKIAADAKQRFSYEVIGKQMHDIYKTLAAEKKDVN